MENLNKVTVNGKLAVVPSKTLKCVIFGNSFSYSTLNYFPNLLQEVLPDTEFTFGLAYKGAGQFTDHIDMFDNNIAYDSYMEFNSTAYREAYDFYGYWNVSLSKDGSNPQTAKSILDRYNWDIIILQQSVEHLDDSANLVVFADKILDYIDYETTFVYNMAQARCPADTSWLPEHFPNVSDPVERSNLHYAEIAEYAQNTLNGQIIQYVLPCGTAVQNLRTTSIAPNTGISGYFSRDTSGHLQDGIGVLVAGYVATAKMLEIIGEKPKTFGYQFFPTNELLVKLNTNFTSSCVGVSNTNILLAEKCAITALKKPYVLTDCSGY